jgi:hypothetical protein
MGSSQTGGRSLSTHPLVKLLKNKTIHYFIFRSRGQDLQGSGISGVLQELKN